MARIGGGTGPKKMTAAQKRIEAARRGATLSVDSPARRGEEDEPRTETVPQQAAPQDVVEPGPLDVTTAKEAHENARRGFSYSKLPDDATDLEKIAHAQRGIVSANQALTTGMGKLERDYVLSAGRYLWDVTENHAYKAANHKTVESFAKSVGLTRQDVYRLRRAVPVYLDIEDLVEEPLNERTIRELAIARNQSGTCREVFIEMKRTGRISSGGAIAARKLLVAGELTEIIEVDREASPRTGDVEKLERARQSLKVDVELLRKVKEQNPEAAREYVDELRQKYEEAAKALDA